MMIKELIKKSKLDECSAVIKVSFKTVADEFALTKENAPTNPAFITADKLIEDIGKGLKLYWLYQKSKLIGCIAIEKGNESIFYIERLAVLPDYRHKGFGKLLLDNALDKIRDQKAEKVSIGIINENKTLKEWYIKYGFIETGTKKFRHLPFTVCFMEKKLFYC